MLAMVEAEERELADRLKAYADTFAALTMSAADAVDAHPESTARQRREARLWVLRMVPQCNTLAAQANPQVGLIDLIGFAASQRQDFDQMGDVRLVFGPEGEKVKEAARQTEVAIWEVAAACVEARDLAVLRSLMDDWLASRKDRPFLGFDRMEFLARARERRGDWQAASGGGFFASLERNIGGTAYELQQLNRQVELLTHYAQHAPTYARWSAEAFVHGMAAELEMQRLREDVSQLSRAIHDLSRAAHELPETQVATFVKLREDTLDQVEARVYRFVSFLSAIIFLLVIGILAALYFYRRACAHVLIRSQKQRLEEGEKSD